MSNLIEFKLFAPANLEASLIGSFSNWQEIPMSKDEKGYFRTQVELTDGSYQYKFRVQTKSPNLKLDSWVDVVDPYATDIDQATQNGVVNIENGQRILDRYSWKHDQKALPENHQLVIYEMHVADFTGEKGDRIQGKTFQRILEKLDYLSNLGVNAIELMPVNEYPGNYSWGYKIRHFFAPESSYGSSEDLKRLIDECHRRGMRVILDGIYNHSDEDSPLLLIDRDYWYYHDQHYPEDPDNYWGPEFNYEHYDPALDIKPAWEFIGDVVRFWIAEYHIDGIRYDAVRQLGNYDFLHWVTQQAKKTAEPKLFYNIGEHIPETTELVGESGPMDGCWHESFRIKILAHLTGETFDLEELKEVLDGTRQGYGSAISLVNYLASHDRNHLMAELGDRGIFDKAAFQRAKLGASLLMTAVGIPLIWMGEEFGGETQQTPNEPNPINWSLLNNDLNQELLEHYQKVIKLRTTHAALFTENLDFFHLNAEAKVIAYRRWNEEKSQIVVIANFSDHDLQNYQVAHFPADGIWHEWIHKNDVEVKQQQLTVELSAWEAKIFVGPETSI